MNFFKYEELQDDEQNEIVSDEQDLDIVLQNDADSVAVIDTAVPQQRVRTRAIRSQEEYESLIIDVYYEEHYHPETREPYQVKVTVFKPQENPLEFIKPAFAFSF